MPRPGRRTRAQLLGFSLTRHFRAILSATYKSRTGVTSAREAGHTLPSFQVSIEYLQVALVALPARRPCDRGSKVPERTAPPPLGVAAAGPPHRFGEGLHRGDVSRARRCRG